MISDLPVFFNETLVFSDDLVINNFEVGIVASRSEAVIYGVVGSKGVLFLIGIEVGKKGCVGFSMVGVQYVFFTTVRSDGEATSVICVKLGDL